MRFPFRRPAGPVPEVPPWGHMVAMATACRLADEMEPGDLPFGFSLHVLSRDGQVVIYSVMPGADGVSSVVLTGDHAALRLAADALEGAFTDCTVPDTPGGTQ